DNVTDHSKVDDPLRKPNAEDLERSVLLPAPRLFPTRRSSDLGQRRVHDGVPDGAGHRFMTRGRCKVEQDDLTRALKAAEAAGVPVKIEIDDGKMTVIMDKTATADGERNEWDEEYVPDQTKVR